MYTIKEAAVRTGVSVPILRAWERRYGVVQPARTRSGYRLYDEESIDRLRTMQRLVRSGWTPSAAAASIIAGTAPRSSSRTSLEPSGQADVVATLIDPFIDAAAALDAATIDTILDDMFAGGSFERVAQRSLMPALEALGQAWAEGRIEVGAEHMASHAVLRRLTVAYEAAGVSGEPGGAILVGLPPGARHELGALAFAVVARRARLPILYLGSDLPAESWVATAVRSSARAAVIGAVTPADRQSARAVSAALREARPDVLIAFGGRFPPPEQSERFGAPRDGSVIRLPVDLVEAVQALIRALALRRPG